MPRRCEEECKARALQRADGLAVWALAPLAARARHCAVRPLPPKEAPPNVPILAQEKGVAALGSVGLAVRSLQFGGAIICAW